MVDVEELYDAEDEMGRLAQIVFPRYERMLVVVHGLVASVLPELDPDDFRLDDPATRRMLAKAAERVVLIDEATRRDIQRVLQQGQELGLSDQQIAEGAPEAGFKGLRGLYQETYRNRSQTIARTELATAQVEAALDRYGATGMVSQVEIVEHEDTDAQCAARNGQVVPLAQQPGLLHPNCRVAVIPLVDESLIPAPAPAPAPSALPALSPEWEYVGTTKEAEQAAKARFPNVEFDFEGMHRNTVNPTMKQFVKLAAEYPKVVERLEYVGGYRRPRVPRPGQGFGGDDSNTWAHASTDGKRIGLNTKWYGDPEGFQRSLKHSVETGYHPKGGDTFESVMTHEFGHQVQHWLESVPQDFAAFPVISYNGEGWVGRTARLWAGTHKANKALSGYAATNKAEGWAEAFAAQYHGSAATKKLAYVKKQKALLEALHPDKWLGRGEWRLISEIPQDERSGAYDRLASWMDTFN